MKLYAELKRHLENADAEKRRGVGSVLTQRIRKEEDYLFPLFVSAMR